jgi:hypothetical protein
MKYEPALILTNLRLALTQPQYREIQMIIAHIIPRGKLWILAFFCGG